MAKTGAKSEAKTGAKTGAQTEAKTEAKIEAGAKTHSGGCHCGRVRYEATTDPGQAIACNCSICSKQGMWLTFVKPEQFKLVSGLDAIGDYQFNKHVIHHQFCRTCGVESFARGKTKDGKAMFAINVRCLDGVDISKLTPKPFDGRSL